MKKLISLFICILLLFIVSGCGNSNVEYLSGDEFTAQMEVYKDYEIYDIDSSHPDVVRCVCASKDNFNITFLYYEIESNSFLNRFYEMNKGTSDLSGNGLRKSETVDGSDYYVISQKGNSVIVVTGYLNNKTEILEKLSKLGY